jgi:hypothetical protein
MSLYPHALTPPTMNFEVPIQNLYHRQNFNSLQLLEICFKLIHRTCSATPQLSGKPTICTAAAHFTFRCLDQSHHLVSEPIFFNGKNLLVSFLVHLAPGNLGKKIKWYVPRLPFALSASLSLNGAVRGCGLQMVRGVGKDDGEPSRAHRLTRR